jgi:large subunit ribosomal protein L7/L12
MDVDRILDELSMLSITEALDLVKKLEKRWGVSSLRRMSKVFDIPPEKEQVQQTEFDVVIDDCGPRKIEVIKVIRMFTEFGLKESKDAAETPGFVLLQGVDIRTAFEAKNLLEKAQARASIK